jgi:hypothetical protein
LKLGDPDVIEKHAEIRETVSSVKLQQAELLEKLHHEQKCLEQELDTGICFYCLTGMYDIVGCPN